MLKKNFEIGDEVRNGDVESMTHGEFGTVVGFHRDLDIVFVKYEDGSFCSFASELYNYAKLTRLQLCYTPCTCNCNNCNNCKR